MAGLKIWKEYKYNIKAKTFIKEAKPILKEEKWNFFPAINALFLYFLKWVYLLFLKSIVLK